MDRENLLKEAEGIHEDFQQLREAGLICRQGLFFPTVHYPPITMYRPVSEESLFGGYTLPADGLFSVYVHVPFCRQYCLFCHYPVKIGDVAEEKDRYLAALEKEMDIYMARLGINKIRARSVLVGGGTPTYVSCGQLERFLAFFRDRVELSCCTQFSFDVDPLTLLGSEGKERLRIMKSSGVERLTIGVQSFDEDILKRMNRPHDAAQAVEAVRQSQEAGFKLNIEFIYGYPGQSVESWIKTMEKAVSLNVEEIQNYRLKIIPYGDHNGFILSDFRNEARDFPRLGETLLMKKLAILILARAGYTENLIRVFSRKKEDFSHYAHDQCCNLFDQLGFGLTAFSSLRDRFGLNVQDFGEYYSSIAAGRLPLNRGLVRGADDQLRWAIVLPLKNRAVYKNYFRKITGVSLDGVFRGKIERLKECGLLSEDDKVLSLTARGRFYADEVSQQFFHPRYIPFPEQDYAPGPLSPYAD